MLFPSSYPWARLLIPQQQADTFTLATQPTCSSNPFLEMGLPIAIQIYTWPHFHLALLTVRFLVSYYFRCLESQHIFHIKYLVTHNRNEYQEYSWG
jgi:hypothetical protein